MSIPTLRDRVRNELTSFAWDQWAQMGVFAPSERRDQWAADPEALLLFSLEIGRDDPRLFDEVLDWMLTNERLVSVQRLRNLSTDDDERELAEAALAWVAHHGPSARFKPLAGRRKQTGNPRPLFRTVAQEVRSPDEVFLTFDLLKPDTPPGGKSRPPDPGLPINFAFRMRHLFGLGSRAEVVRYLITFSETAVPAQSIAEAAGYAKRNVNETLAALVASRTVTTFEVGNERRYLVSRAHWDQLLELQPGARPTYRDWPRLLFALRRLYRWFEDTKLDQLSRYMLASEARTLMNELESSLATASVLLPSTASAQGEDYWAVFEQSVDQVLSALTHGWV
jgi:hypothetical protein